MKSDSHHVKKEFKTVHDIVNGQDLVVDVVAFFRLENLYNRTIVDY